ncbi:PREDICTED: DNA repair protein XRCC2 isoform X3 [Chinchilla lanigera]|uniref:DNA repair protein XRCC2 isoform X3 n=1 Tax=Chinchilla lanigera TaxID=34839 RepID=UPI000695CC5B|nr:PREDICTED: DNA repair protein XRCC2 isoform X3 [Chinchilla lanigera]
MCSDFRKAESGTEPPPWPPSSPASIQSSPVEECQDVPRQAILQTRSGFASSSLEDRQGRPEPRLHARPLLGDDRRALR